MDERADLSEGRLGATARADFHRNLDAIDEAFTGAAVRIAESLPALNAATLDGDPRAASDGARLAQAVHDRIAEVEDAGLVLLAREAPVGRDLRRLVAILRLVRDVDRSAALLGHASGSVTRIDLRLLPTSLRRHVEELTGRSAEVFACGVDAWRRRDALAVMEVDALDEAVDRAQRHLYDELSATRGVGDETLTVGLLARYCERIADHGVSIARDTAFVVTGERVTV